MESNEGIINIHSVIQKWTDQALSCNHYYDPQDWEDGRVPMNILADDSPMEFHTKPMFFLIAATDQH